MLLAVIRPLPRQVVDGDVQMPDPRRHVARGRPAHSQRDAKALHLVRDEHHALGQRTGPGSGGFTMSLGAGSLPMGTTALWAEAPVESTHASRDRRKRLDEQVSLHSLPFEICYTERLSRSS